jgi:hypothetical protein
MLDHTREADTLDSPPPPPPSSPQDVRSRLSAVEEQEERQFSEGTTHFLHDDRFEQQLKDTSLPRDVSGLQGERENENERTIREWKL